MAETSDSIAEEGIRQQVNLYSLPVFVALPERPNYL